MNIRYTVAALIVILSSNIMLSDEPDATSEVTIAFPSGGRLNAEAKSRIVEGFATQKDQFLQLLIALDTHRIDSQDDLQTILDKQKAITALLEKHKQKSLANLTPPELVLDYIRIRNATTPRPSGNTIKVNSGESLADVSGRTRAGDVVQLGEGDYDFAKFDRTSDLTFLGKGPTKTRLHFERGTFIGDPFRWRIVGCEIDCNDSPFASLHPGTSLALENCRVLNYNSGAGGSNAIYGTGTVLRIENCVFDGLPGRSNGARSMGGNAFDLREANVLYVRHSEFINNSSIVRTSFPCVFDRCSSSHRSGRSYGVLSSERGVVFVRGSQIPSHGMNPVRPFSHSVEDAAFVNHVLGKPAPNRQTQQLAAKLQLFRSVPYWIGLLQHPSWTVRSQAAARVEQLVGERVNVPTPRKRASQEEIDKAIVELDSKDFDTRAAAAEELDAWGFQAEASLRQLIEKGGTRRQETAAKALLARLDMTPWISESNQLLQWYEDRKDRLQWNASKGKYEPK